MRIGLILGIGVVGTLDEVVLHQLLQWHNFYVHTTQYWRVVGDGLFHLFSGGLLFLGAMLLWVERHRNARTEDSGLKHAAGEGRALVAGILLGMGGFNLYDGIVQHKLLGFHPVREGVAPTPGKGRGPPPVPPRARGRGEPPPLRPGLQRRRARPAGGRLVPLAWRRDTLDGTAVGISRSATARPTTRSTDAHPASPE